MRRIDNIPYHGTNDKKLDMYLPDEAGFPTVVYFHGGGLEGGSKDNPRIADFASSFVGEGYGFVSVEYSLYSEGAHYPDYLDDCADAVGYVASHIRREGGNGRLLISGQSAGAWISLMLCLDTPLLTSRGISPEEIDGWIIDSAQTTAHFNVIRKELHEDERRQLINEYAPLYYLNENTKFSRMLLLCYQDDMPCRPEQNALFSAAIKAYNADADVELIRLPGGHCHGSSVKNPDGTYDYVTEALRWLKKR